MPVSVAVLEEGRILHYQFVTPWEIHDLKAYIQDELTLRNVAPHPIHTIVDFSQSPSLPRGVLQARTFPTFTHPNSGLVAMVIRHGMVRGIVEGGLKLVRNKRVHFFETTDHALDFLKDVMEKTPSTQSHP